MLREAWRQAITPMGLADMSDLDGEEGLEMIRNLTPHGVILLREDPEGEITGYLGYGTQAAPRRFRVIDTFPTEPEGPARAVASTRVVGGFGEHGIPLTHTSYGAPENLPDPELWTQLIVSLITAQAARAHGRSTGDLLILGETVRDAAGGILGCTSFGVLDPEAQTA